MVVFTRLERRTILRCCVHFPSATDAPARFTTASAPAIVPCESARDNPSDASGSQGTSTIRESFDGAVLSFFRPPFFGATLSRRTNRHTECPSPTSDLISAVPTRPVAPVIKTFIHSPQLE